MSSDGPWMANKSLFEKNNFEIFERLDRFELMVKSFYKKEAKPSFFDWTKQQSHFTGWNLIYSDQCPWHERSITDLQQSAIDNGIELNVTKLRTAKEAQYAPSGFGTFSLVKDGKLLADHYISKTRFENILRQVVKNQNK
ncbi:MAG: YoaP domain-containing protein [Bacteroidales bacterium]